MDVQLLLSPNMNVNIRIIPCPGALRRGVVAAGLLVAVLALLAATPLHAAVLTPAPPAPPRLVVPALQDDEPARSDFERLADAIALIANRRIGEADLIARSFRTEIAQKIVEWLIVQDKESGVDFARISRFASQNPRWPRISRIRALAESAMLEQDVPPEQVLAFFSSRLPVSGEGQLALARAYLLQGNTQKARALASAAWRDKTLTQESEEIALRDMAELLGEKDHRARLVRLIYRRETEAALRVSQLLDSGRQALAASADAFLNRGSRAAQKYRAVPAHLASQPVLQYARIRYLRRTKNYPRARKILRRILAGNPNFTYPRAWWIEQRTLARLALGERKAREAYNLVRYNHFKSGRNFLDVEYHAGWIAFSWLKDTRLALKHFVRLRRNARKDSEIAMGDYWLGRAYARLGEKAQARSHFEAAAAFQRTYYGQLASDALGRAAARVDFGETPKPSSDTADAQKADELYKVARLLQDAGQPDLVTPFVVAMAYRQKTARELAGIANIAWSFALPHLAVKVGKIGLSRGLDIKAHLYPVRALPKFKPLTPAIDPALLLGLSRQESEFNLRAVSSAGARGLMQLMPGTAEMVARKYRQPYVLERLTSNAQYNLRLGSALLYDLVAQYNGSYFMAAAAYNAGPGNVTRWVRQYGDPRTGQIDPVDWIEAISFTETRNYVKQVLKNTIIYRSRLNMSSLRTLTQDLLRGVKR